MEQPSSDALTSSRPSHAVHPSVQWLCTYPCLSQPYTCCALHLKRPFSCLDEHARPMVRAEGLRPRTQECALLVVAPSRSSREQLQPTLPAVAVAKGDGKRHM